MNTAHRRFEIAQRLSQAGTAHEQFQIVTMQGVYDQAWPEWYAGYCLDHGWNRLFEHTWTLEELAEGLRQADREHRANAPTRRWPDYYAEFFVKTD
jgi:hypothetical protein